MTEPLQPLQKHSERLARMLDRMLGQFTAQELSDLKRAILVIERVEQGQGFAVSTAVNRDGVARVDVSWMGMLANIDPLLARQVGDAIIAAAAQADAEAGLVAFLRGEMSLDMDQVSTALSAFRESRKPTASDRPALIHRPFGG